MDFTELLQFQAVKVLSSVSSKKRLLREIADLAALAYDMDTDVIINALTAREALGPTGVGGGVALPHARIPGLDRVTGLFIMLEKPVDFNALDHQPVDIVFALFAPENSGAEHLKALALVSRTLRDVSICNKLRVNLEAAKLYALLSEARTAFAA